MNKQINDTASTGAITYLKSNYKVKALLLRYFSSIVPQRGFYHFLVTSAHFMNSLETLKYIILVTSAHFMNFLETLKYIILSWLRETLKHIL